MGNITTENDLLQAYGVLYVYAQKIQSETVTESTNTEINDEIGSFGIHTVEDLQQAITICTTEADARGITPDKLAAAIADAEAYIANGTTPDSSPVPSENTPSSSPVTSEDILSDPNIKTLAMVLLGGIALGLVAMGLVKEEKKKTVATLIGAVAGSSLALLYVQNKDAHAELKTAKAKLTISQKLAADGYNGNSFSVWKNVAPNRLSLKIKHYFYK